MVYYVISDHVVFCYIVYDIIARYIILYYRRLAAAPPPRRAQERERAPR